MSRVRELEEENDELREQLTQADNEAEELREQLRVAESEAKRLEGWLRAIGKWEPRGDSLENWIGQCLVDENEYAGQTCDAFGNMEANTHG